MGDAIATDPVFEEADVALSDVPPTTAAFLFGGGHAGEQLRAVGTRLRLGAKGKLIRTLAVVSSVEGDGKTSVAVGLAAASVHAGQRVLLIEADLRRRQVCPMLGIEPARGLAEWLEGGDDVLLLRRAQPGGFHLLSAGIDPCRPELLGAPRMTTLLGVAERCFDLVILDCAPLLPVADSLALRQRVRSFLMVVRARHSPREAVVRATAMLGRGKIVGVILNGYRSNLPVRKGYPYGSGYYYAARPPG